MTDAPRLLRKVCILTALASFSACQATSTPVSGSPTEAFVSAPTCCSPSETGDVSIDVHDEDVKVVLQAIAMRSGSNIVIAEGVEGSVSLSLSEVSARDAIAAVAEAIGCTVIEEADGILPITRVVKHAPVKSAPTVRQAANDSTVSIDVQDAPVKSVLESIAMQSGVNIVIAADVEGTVTLKLDEMPWRDAISSVAEAVGCSVIEDTAGIIPIVRVVKR